LQFLAQAEWSSHTDASRSAFRVDVDELLARQKTGLEAYLSKRVYQHEDLVRVRRIAQHQVRELLDNLIGHPERVPARFRAREDEVGLRRCAADYLAGMTDRFCRKQYRLLVSSSPEAK
jgi:dGTPase